MATKRPTRTLAAAAFLGLDQQAGAGRRPVKKARISAPARTSSSPSPDRESASPSPPTQRSRIPRSLISGGTTIKTSRLNVVKKSRTPVMEIDEILDTFNDDEEEEEEVEEERTQVSTIRQAPNTRFLGNLLQHTMNHNERVLTMANLTAADDDDIVVEDPLEHDREEDDGHGTFRYQRKKVITRQQQKEAEEEDDAMPRTRVVRGRGGITLSGGSDVTDNYLHKHLFDKTRIAKLSAKQRRMKGVALLHSIAKLYHIEISIKPVVVNNSDVDGPINKKETDRLRILVDNGTTSTGNKKRKRMIDFDGIGGEEEEEEEDVEEEEETQEEATQFAVDEMTEEQLAEETESTETTEAATETATETPAPILTRKPSASTSTPTLTRKTSTPRSAPKPAVLDRAGIREAFLAAKRKKENGGVTPKAATGSTMTYDIPEPTAITPKTSMKTTSSSNTNTTTSETTETDADAADLSWLEQKRLKAQAFANERAARLAAQESKSQTETETRTDTTPASTSSSTSKTPALTKTASKAATTTASDTPSTTKSPASPTSAPRRTTSSTSSTASNPSTSSSTSSTDKKRPRRSGGLFSALTGLGQR